jgi:hypothetical protein
MQPVRIFETNAVGMLRQLVQDVFGAQALAGQMPHDGLERLATLAIRHPIANDAVVISPRGVSSMKPRLRCWALAGKSTSAAA